MLIRMISLTLLVGLPAVSGGQPDAPREGPPPATAADLKPFTMAVVDAGTGEPVTKFSYTVGYEAPGRVGWHERARDLRLLSAMNDVSGIPTTGKNLIILAVVQDVLHFRIFDGHGAMVVDTDEGKRRAELTGEIEDLKLLLEKLWPPHGLTNIEKDQVVTAITSIVGHAFKDDLQPVESPSGTFIVQTPPACLLFVRVWWRELEAGSNNFHEFVVRSTDNLRRAVVKLKRGATVHGTVRDAATGRPIAGATVSPNVPLSIIIGGIGEGQATSDKDGHYQLRGVRLESGVEADHPNYRRQDVVLDGKQQDKSLFDVNLLPLDSVTLQGTVRDASGQPLEACTVIPRSRMVWPGPVRDANGEVLEGVTLYDSEKRVQTTREGTYSLHLSVGGHEYSNLPDLLYSKRGYVTREVPSDEVAKDALAVVLERQVSLEGQVLGPDGQPVKGYTVRAGTAAKSLESVRSKYVERIVADAAGRFQLRLDREGKTWVGVRAAGHASSKVLTDVPPGGGYLVVRLEPGAAVTGKVLAPPGRLSRVLRARLVPRWNRSDGREFSSPSEIEDWIALTTNVAADGTLRFDHVRPDRYTLELHGPGVTPRQLALDVPGGGLDLGQIRLAGRPGRGRIHGRVFKSKDRGGGPWRFATGEIASRSGAYRHNIPFMSDEEGWFSVEGVPAGRVSLGFLNIMSDVIEVDTQDVEVSENQTTEMRLLGPAGSRSLAVELRIGDGSKAQCRSGSPLADQPRAVDVAEPGSTLPPQPERLPLASPQLSPSSNPTSNPLTALEPSYRVELIPLSGRPLSSVRSDWVEFDSLDQLVLPDVSPGAYRLRVVGRFDLSNSGTEAIFERDITAPTDAKPVKVSLGAGSIKGRFLGAGDFAGGSIEVIAVARGEQGVTRRTRCNIDGNFCVRYLDAGTYTLFAHFPKGSWCRVDNLTVASNVIDIGERRLVGGATVRGSISFRRPCPPPDEVMATGPSQVSLEPFKLDSGVDQFELGGLWPGRWTLTARGDGQVLATAQTEVSGTEKVGIELAAATEQQP